MHWYLVNNLELYIFDMRFQHYYCQAVISIFFTNSRLICRVLNANMFSKVEPYERQTDSQTGSTSRELSLPPLPPALTAIRTDYGC